MFVIYKRQTYDIMETGWILRLPLYTLLGRKPPELKQSTLTSHKMVGISTEKFYLQCQGTET